MVRRKRSAARAEHRPRPAGSRWMIRRLIWAGIVDGDDPQSIAAMRTVLKNNPDIRADLRALETDAEVRAEIESRRTWLQARHDTRFAARAAKRAGN